MFDTYTSLVQSRVHQIFLLEKINMDRSVPVWPERQSWSQQLRVRLGELLIQCGLKIKGQTIGQPVARPA